MILPTPDIPSLNLYGLPAIGYGAHTLELTGDYLRDQLKIESVCFRIGLRTEEGGLGKDGHFKAIVDLIWNNPDIKSKKRFIHNSWSDRIIRELCEQDELGVAGCASAGKSDPCALWALVSYIADPTHTLCLVMSTTLKGANKRIFKSLTEYWNGAPGLPGKPLWSTNEIRGVTYDGKGFGGSSGIYLMASEQSSEKSALEKLIGIKAPRTGEAGRSFEELMASDEYADLAAKFDEEYLRDLIPRLENLSEDRIGKIILVIDEATGCSPSILNVVNSNMKPGNVGHLQVVLIGNPNSHYDCFGEFCTPAGGWSSVSLDDYEWETATGGKCIRFNAEENPRITEGNEKLSWMLRLIDILQMEKTYGRTSLYFYRMILGFWSPTGVDTGIYTQADIEVGGALKKCIWGLQKPRRLTTLDPSFSSGGDKASCSFFEYGDSMDGLKTLELTEQVGLVIDISDVNTPVCFQLVQQWRNEARKRGIIPSDAAFDATGAIGFADIVKSHWSPAVLAVSSAGKPSRTPIGAERNAEGQPITAAERFSNKATEIWLGAHAFMRSGQIKGIPAALAKQLCSRQYSKGSQGDGRVLTVESKRIYKGREGGSPDDSDSFLLGVELAKARLGFRPAEKAGNDPLDNPEGKTSTWAAFCKRARSVRSRMNLPS